jgi:homoserine O-acetyltransferase
VQVCHLPSPFRLVHGGELAGASLAYERFGRADGPLVVVLGGISAGRHVAAHAAAPAPGWWEGIVGPGRAIDPAVVQVLAFDWLGGAGASTAPAAGETFPFVDAADQAAALWHLLDVLRLPRVHALVGSSYGGMVALHAAAQRPRSVAKLCVLAAAHRSDPLASAWRKLQRDIVELGVRHGDARSALAIARGLAMTSYRSAGELRERFPSAPVVRDGRLQQPVHDWLRAHGERFANAWTVEAFLCLSASIDAHTIDPRTVAVPTWLLAFVGDALVPPSEVRELALGLPTLRAHREVRSRYGHDGFLKETAAVAALLAEVLS